MGKICKRPRSLKGHLFILLLLFLIGAAINFPVAVACIKSRMQQPRVPQTFRADGKDAAQLHWPTQTPQDFEWPSIDQWIIHSTFGYKYYYITAVTEVEGRNTAVPQMQYELMGWPIPSLERVQMWWLWDDPIWKTTAEPDPAMRVHWAGAIGNPVIFALGVWLLFFASIDGWRRFVRRRRMKRKRCPDCGYDLRATEGPVCSECGWNRAVGVENSGAEVTAHLEGE